MFTAATQAALVHRLVCDSLDDRKLANQRPQSGLKGT